MTRCGLCRASGEFLIPIRADLPFGAVAGQICLQCLGEVGCKGRRLLDWLFPTAGGEEEVA